LNNLLTFKKKEIANKIPPKITELVLQQMGVFDKWSFWRMPKNNTWKKRNPFMLLPFEVC